MDYATSGFIAGAVGDVGLQVADTYGFGNKGLERYFRSRPRILSVLYAALLTGGWSAVYGLLRRDKGNPIEFAIFAGLIDVLYRREHGLLFPSLSDYYEQNSFVATVAYNVATSFAVEMVKQRL